MVDMVERVARAIVASRELPPGCDINWPAFRRDAKAAIEAMRAPSPKMLRAACAAMSPGKRPTLKRVSEKAKHGIRYRAMIDEALAEGTAPCGK